MPDGDWAMRRFNEKNIAQVLRIETKKKKEPLKLAYC